MPPSNVIALLPSVITVLPPLAPTALLLAAAPAPPAPILIAMVASAAIGRIADETQRLESLYQQKLANLDELKQSLLHQAFSGQL